MQTIPSKLCFAIAMLVATATPVFGDVSVAQVIQFKLTAAGPMGRSTGSGPVKFHNIGTWEFKQVRY